MDNNVIPFEKDLDNSSFEMVIGNTTYLVSTHFNEESTQSILSQFLNYIESS